MPAISRKSIQSARKISRTTNYHVKSKCHKAGELLPARKYRRNWLLLALSQGDTFLPLAHEAGGRLGAQALDFLDVLPAAAGGSQSGRVAFKTYAFQRLRATNFRGVALLINSRPVLRTGPEVPPERGALPLPPPLRSVINISSHLCFPHDDHASTILLPRTSPAI